ncbi:flavin reductase family protein [Corynebacterium lowii]|uniref:Flavin-dependent monooxygenase, reductase subunit HsaB n=1 Tax=Corynebacterium lowii TaxID=1544413 RepID=A0A0Q1E329_9CORY|nr:flavin reductase family protein [Corynebacterium lowii]KQB87046.1 Flavin-dependent monooxygenase, reductase subunit HsaB [Corynebacterium lowii]MDP9852372.1 flavin reductase (DIM6/NTAB) family NADH-FMN oxidoreductase RutF [Corynebacterium lowii]
MTSPALHATHLRTILAHVPTSITAVAALVEGVPAGMICGSFVGLSLEPPLVGLSIQKTSSTWPLLRRAGSLGISVLTEDHREVVRQIAGPASQRFANLGWQESEGAVLLDAACAHLRTRLHAEVDTGDHVLSVLEVLDATEFLAAAPLVFHGSQITTVAPAWKE